MLKRNSVFPGSDCKHTASCYPSSWTTSVRPHTSLSSEKKHKDNQPGECFSSRWAGSEKRQEAEETAIQKVLESQNLETQRKKKIKNKSMQARLKPQRKADLARDPGGVGGGQ